MKTLFIIAIMLGPVAVTAQRLHLNLFGGFANYMGDMQDKPVTFDQSNGAFGAGLQCDLTNRFSLRGGVMYGKVSASDKFNRKSLQVRNLSFETKIVEGNLFLQYNLFDPEEKKLIPYVFGGVAVYHFNPYSFDSLGYRVLLQPLSTEGQGLDQYPDRKPYKLTQFAMPMGLGFKLRVSENVTLGYELGMRKLFTDYLDDLSTTYVDKAALNMARGAKAVEMAYRGDELKIAPGTYPSAFSIRGGAKHQDWYYFQGLTLSIGLRTGRSGWGSSGTGCPVRVL